MNFLVNKIGCTPNCFISAFFNVKTKENFIYEISSRKNDYKEIIKKISEKNTIIIGYGNFAFDNILYNFLIDNYYVFLESNYSTICVDLYYLCKKISTGEDVTELKYKKFFESIDLKTLLFSKENRLSLEEMQASIKYSTISNFKELKDNPTINLNIVRRCVVKDCLSIVSIFKQSKKYLQLRMWVFKNLGIDCLALDNVTSGSLILGKKYCETVGIDYNTFRATKRFFIPVNIKNIVLPIINFETIEFNKALETLKGITIPEKSKYPSIPIIYKERKFTLTGGGLHIVSDPAVYTNGIYIQADCISQYPSFIHNHKLLDPTFDPRFLDIYHEAYEQKELFKDDPIKREFFKLILNSYYGCLLNEHKPFHCPEIAFKTVINCQLLMLMLAETLINNNINVVSLNTDSIDVFLLEGQRELYDKIMAEWMVLSKFELTFNVAKRVFRKDCNSYIMELLDGTLITKGDYNISNEFGKIHDSYISKLASVNKIVYNIPIEETVLKSTEIFDFCQFKTIDSKNDLYIGNDKIQNSCRFYTSTDGGYLYKKSKTTKKIESINKGFMISVVNDCVDSSITNKNINYGYYIRKATNLVDAINQKQIKLNF